MNARRKLFFLSGKGGSPAPVGLLNTTAGAGADFAHSLRLLNADFIGQDAIEVLRVSDSASRFFPLTASGVDTAAIASFCSASDGVVGWMLDQSGNGRHAQQTALSSAPKIYDRNTGIVKNENDLPSLFFDGGDDTLILPDNIYTDTDGILVFSIGSYDASAASGLLNIVGTLSTGAKTLVITNEIGVRTGGGFATFGAPLAGVSLNTIYKPTNGHIFDIECYVDGTERLRVDGSDNAMDYGIGSSINYMVTSTGSNYRQGTMTEVISYPPAKITNRIPISNNIKNAYNIS